jgi:hypothetical protein
MKKNNIYQCFTMILICLVPNVHQSSDYGCMNPKKRLTLFQKFIDLQSTYRFKRIVSFIISDTASVNSIECNSLITDDIHSFLNTKVQIPTQICSVSGNETLEELLNKSVLDIHGKEVLILVWSTSIKHESFHHPANIINPLQPIEHEVNF